MTLGNKFPESLIRTDYTRYYCYYRFRAELRNSFFVASHRDVFVEREACLAVPSKRSVKDFLHNHKEDLVSAQLWLDGKIAFSFSYLHRKNTNKVENRKIIAA